MIKRNLEISKIHISIRVHSSIFEGYIQQPFILIAEKCICVRISITVVYLIITLFINVKMHIEEVQSYNFYLKCSLLEKNAYV